MWRQRWPRLCLKPAWPCWQRTSASSIMQRRQFLKELYKSRITPQDVRQMLESGERIVILDLRHPLDSARRSAHPARRHSRSAR